MNDHSMAEGQSERSYAILFNASREGLAHYQAICDPAGKVVDLRVLEINPAASELSGVPREKQIGRTWLEVWPDLDRQLFAHYQRADETGEAVRFDHHSPQTGRSYDVKIVPVSSGEFVVSFPDVTEHKRAEKERQALLVAIQQERDRLSALVKSISDEIWYVDAKRKVTVLNPAVTQEFGLSVGEGMDVEKIAASLEVYRPDGTPRPPGEAPLSRALRGEVIRDLEEMIRTPAKGELRHRQVSAAPVRGPGGAIVGSVCVVRDITDRKVAEEAVRESEQRFRSIAESLSEGLMLFDLSGNVIYQNPASLRIHGYQSARAGQIQYGQLPGTWQGWDVNGQPLPFDQWPISRALRREHVQDQILRAVRVDTGLEFHASYNGCPICDVHGNMMLGFITIRDITEQHKAEAALRKSQERYRGVVENTTAIIDSCVRTPHL